MQSIGRQIQLPMRKAIEIAWKNIRMRLSRSLLVTSGIVLALAFLMSILTGDALVESLRRWDMQALSQTAARDLRPGQELQALLQSHGVETESKDDRVRTRWVVSLALLVAFVGILNAMLMSVTERFREIGTMKCLGALDGFIVKLFLIESLFQGIAGTTLGVTIGLILGVAGALFNYGRFVWKAFPAGAIALGAVLCFVIGIGLTVIAAVYPAWQAARMQPVEAMRVET
ncbi:MAG TPA: FtsX-like permease family protein [Tepidisphaeraceae bacterium]|jgi:predicted lysophospholipase L1 biosynthesis ABC-type transport system permease subunit|nr:FtsX-like permease family protein [Tepidisphaeraceae bacterium]